MRIRKEPYSDLSLVLKPMLDAPPVNIIAMAAPEVFYDLRGKNYPLEHLIDLFNNAYTAFHLVKEFDQSTHKKTQITTGRWGAGAFGHNVSMVISIQYLAARLAEVNSLKFTGISESEGRPAVQWVDQLLDSTLNKSKKQKGTSSETFLSQSLSFLGSTLGKSKKEGPSIETFLSKLLSHPTTQDWKTRPL